jgi:hypothetical protein
LVADEKNPPLGRQGKRVSFMKTGGSGRISQVRNLLGHGIVGEAHDDETRPGDSAGG